MEVSRHQQSQVAHALNIENFISLQLRNAEINEEKIITVKSARGTVNVFDITRSSLLLMSIL